MTEPFRLNRLLFLAGVQPPAPGCWGACSKTAAFGVTALTAQPTAVPGSLDAAIKAAEAAPPAHRPHRQRRPEPRGR